MNGDYGADEQTQGHGSQPTPGNPTTAEEAVALEKDAAGNPPGLGTAK